MSARKLARFAGLVFVLAAISASGVGAADLTAKHNGAHTTYSAIQAGTQEVVWE